MRSLMALAFFCLLLVKAHGQTKSTDITGTWLNDKEDAHVEIYQKGDDFFGKIVWLKEPNAPNGEPKTDQNNPTKSLRTREIMGIDIISDLSFDGRTWEGGKVYLPKKGKEADCSADLSEDHNSLTLHITKLWFSTSVTWTRL